MVSELDERSSSEDGRDAASEADEQWDDMAIVRAFEDALNDQRQRSGAPIKKQAVKSSRSARKQSRRVSVDDDDVASSTTAPAPAEAASPAYDYAPSSSSGYHQQGFAAHQPQPQPQANGYAVPNTSEHGSQHDVYQLAYAQAYASLQAQFQAAAQQPSPAQYPTGYGYGAPQAPSYSAQHFQPPIPQSLPVPPFPTAPGVIGVSGATDDGLSNLLLAWYQSGYYTGRFQAMQEMKARNQR